MNDMKRAAAMARVADEARRLYDALDIDHLNDGYFSSGSEGQKWRRLRDAIRAWRDIEAVAADEESAR